MAGIKLSSFFSPISFFSLSAKRENMCWVFNKLLTNSYDSSYTKGALSQQRSYQYRSVLYGLCPPYCNFNSKMDVRNFGKPQNPTLRP